MAESNKNTDGFDFSYNFVAKEHNGSRNAPQQFIMPECYGLGKRLCDIHAPAIPFHCLEKMRMHTPLNSDLAPYLRRRGKGRAEALRNKTDHKNFEASTDFRPSGLAAFSKETVATENGEEGNVFLKGNSQEDVGASLSHGQTNGQFENSETDSCLGWTLLPPYVVQLEGLPSDLDLSVLHDVVAHYGTILDTEQQENNGKLTVRFKLNSSAACSWLVTNLDDVDFLGSGHNIKCTLVDS